jgi:hypothetical protein
MHLRIVVIEGYAPITTASILAQFEYRLKSDR